MTVFKADKDKQNTTDLISTVESREVVALLKPTFAFNYLQRKLAKRPIGRDIKTMQKLKQYLVDLLSYQGTIVIRGDGNGISLSNFLQPQVSSEFRGELPLVITSHLAIPPIEIVPVTGPKKPTHANTLLDFYFENYSWKGKKFNLEEYIDLKKVDDLKEFVAGKSESHKLLALKVGFGTCVSKNGLSLEQANTIVFKWGGLKKINKDSRCWKICSSKFSKKASMKDDMCLSS